MIKNKCIVTIVKENGDTKHYVVRSSEEDGITLIGKIAIHGDIAAICETYEKALEVLNKIV